MDTIRVGGVPEHFNTPWHWQKGKELFEQNQLNIQWQDFPGGTGAMSEALQNGELDIALLLTEGAVASISKGNPSKIIRYYVASPLVWGIFTPADADIQSLEDLENQPFAISRYGSGSHLMLQLLAKEKGWDLGHLRYVVTQNIGGTRKAFQSKEALGFMWETFTTQPYVDAGEFRRVGEFPTPWSCFVMAATESFLAAQKEVLPRLFSAIDQSCKALKNHSETVEIISRHASLKPSEIEKWLPTVNWASDDHVPFSEIESVAQTLVSCGVLDGLPDVKQLVFSQS